MPIPVDYDKLAVAVGDTILAAATRLPADIAAALEKAYEAETEATSRSALAFIVENIRLSAEYVSPICQDTGYPTFYLDIPKHYDKARVKEIIKGELKKATADSKLRPNAVDTLSGKNSGNNIGISYPAFYVEENDGDVLTLKLILKGGGSENVSTQYKLPHGPVGAGRDLNGVRKVVLDGIFQAQGYGCGPGVIGVAIGGDRAQGYALAKKQLLRPLGDTNPVPELAEFEATVGTQANEMGIGAMGFGGKTTVLGVKAVLAHRHPASFFVTIAYGCWALRRKVMVFDGASFRVSDEGGM